MHLLLLIPSSLLLILLFMHSWKYRGSSVTILFFVSCFAFGVLRGNLIYFILTSYMGDESLPYLFVHPVVQIGHASLQECVGWIFSLYLSWSIAERLLSGREKGSVPVFRLIGLACFLTGTMAYAVEAAAGAAKWWVWTIPVKNSFFVNVPVAGIIAWISVGFDFFGPFLLLCYGKLRHKAKYLLFGLFPLHMVSHMKFSEIAEWLPLTPFEIWHWLMICLLLYGVVLGGPEMAVPARTKKEYLNPLVSNAIWITSGVFILVLGVVHSFIVQDPRQLISLVSFLGCILFIRPLAAAVFFIMASLAYGLFFNMWTNVTVPVFILLVFGASTGTVSDYFSHSWSKWFIVFILIISSCAVYLHYRDRMLRIRAIRQISLSLENASSLIEAESIMSLRPRPRRSADVIYYNSWGTRLLRLGNYFGAVRLLEEGLACDSSYSYLYFNLGWAYLQTGNSNAAIKAYEKGLELNPIDFDSYLTLGELYKSMGLTEKAESLYHRALKYKY